MYHSIHVHALSLFSIFWCNEIKDGVLSFFPHCYISRYFLDTLWNKSYWLMIYFFFLQNLSWHINGMKEHNQNFSLGIQIHVSFIWSILGIFLLLEIWSKLVIFYWNMICFIIIEKSFSVRISFLVTSFWNDILSDKFLRLWYQRSARVVTPDLYFMNLCCYLETVCGCTSNVLS